MTELNDSKPLSAAESIAESISQGESIEWESFEQKAADDYETGVLKALQLLDRIATFHRHLGPPPAPEPMPSQRDPPKTTGDDPRTWAHFEIIERIGEGTFGAVYRARDTKLQSEVALKLLWSDAGGTRSDPSRALKEARLLARVRHPNVVSVYGADLVDGRVGVWMELVKGKSLAELMRVQGPFSAREATIVGLDVCRALAAVHGAGLMHGDVKAHNVMREEGGRTLLMDFGTGKDLATVGTASGREPSGDFAGTPLYLPPEVFDGRQRTKSTDIYSLGVLLYHLVTNAYPVEGRTSDEVKNAHRKGERRHIRDVRPDAPEAFVQVVERALATDPRARYQSVGVFEEALATLLSPRNPIPIRPHLFFRNVTAIAIVCIVALAGMYWLAHRGASAGTGAEATDASNKPTPPADPSTAYTIDAALYHEAKGQGIRLRHGARVEPGTEIFAEVRTSAPTYVYIANEDENGNSFLLFPLPGQTASNPLPAGKVTRLPGMRDNQDYYWYVDQAGGREHFIIFASPQPLGDFEQRILASLPRPEIGKPILSARISREALGTLRSVGGLAPASGPSSSTNPGGRRSGLLTQTFTTPLSESEETAHGLWVRQLTLENPR